MENTKFLDLSVEFLMAISSSLYIQMKYVKRRQKTIYVRFEIKDGCLQNVKGENMSKLRVHVELFVLYGLFEKKCKYKIALCNA